MEQKTIPTGVLRCASALTETGREVSWDYFKLLTSGLIVKIIGGLTGIL
jgi:hypothetical protein